MHLQVKANYGDPLWGTFGFNIIVHIILLFQKHGTFNIGYQFWFLGPTIISFTKLMLCNITLKIIINFIIYIKGSMNIFIVYIGIIGSQSCFYYTNFKIINFNEILKRAHLTMLVIFYVDVIICQIFNLSHIYRIFLGKTHFLI